MGTIRLQVGGVQYDSFEAISVEVRLDSVCRSFSAQTSSEDGTPLPIKGGEETKVYVDDELVLTGRVEVVEGNGDASSHEISIKGRSRTSDLVDSTLDTMSDLRPPITLKTVAERVIANIHSTLEVVDEVSPAAFTETELRDLAQHQATGAETDYNDAEDVLAPEPGNSAFEFLERLARKRQVLLTDDAQGRLVITRAAGVNGGGSLIHRPDDDENNVVRYSFSYDLTNRMHRYVVISQMNATPAALLTAVDNGSVVTQRSQLVLDTGVSDGRQLVIVSESPFSSGTGTMRAVWEANARKSRSQVYSAVVHGFRDQAEALWLVNRLVRVDDVFAGLDTVMLVNTVTFALTEDGGSSSSLSLVNRDAYLVALAKPEKERKEVGKGLILGAAE